jgi:two-component system response regulator VicR
MAMESTRQKRVIYIEDDPEMIELIHLILQQHHFTVKGALSGDEGLAIIRRESPDLILLDLMMPNMDGWEVYQQLKTDPKTRNIPVIIITARAQPIDRVLGLHIVKVDDYISKPFKPQELLNSIERVLNEQHTPT